MSFNVFLDKNNFIITNSADKKADITLTRMRDNSFNVFGYCFLDDDILKNTAISEKQYAYIAENQSSMSGIFTAISNVDEKIEITLDPLVQYNLFYHIDNQVVTISNNLTLIAQLHNLTETEENHLFDSIAYKSPLRGLTVLKNVFAVQYDDLINNVDVDVYKVPLPLLRQNLEFKIPDSSIYSALNYDELLKLYINKLNSRAKILAEKFEEVHVQLTGGADSRLALSSFLNYNNIYCYVLGDGSSQNRLYYENICNSLNLNKCERIEFSGQNLSNSSLIFRALYDSNFRKFYNLNTYMNSDDFILDRKCKITGYYGANVCGGISFPPVDTTKHIRTNLIPAENFTYHDYVKLIKNKYDTLRSAALKDIFYLNNRGPSHYAAHSIADNLKCNSFDILYDPINLELVKKCPYKNSDIDRNAISIDLIYLNNPLLALFPYDDRKIPMYREFNNIPLLNCFSGLKFSELDIPRIRTVRPTVDIDLFDILNKGDKHTDISSMLNYEEFGDFFVKHPFLHHLKQDNTTTSTIVLYYILSGKLLSKLVNGESKGQFFNSVSSL